MLCYEYVQSLALRGKEDYQPKKQHTFRQGLGCFKTKWMTSKNKSEHLFARPPYDHNRRNHDRNIAAVCLTSAAGESAVDPEDLKGGSSSAGLSSSAVLDPKDQLHVERLPLPESVTQIISTKQFSFGRWFRPQRKSSNVFTLLFPTRSYLTKKKSIIRQKIKTSKKSCCKT